MGSGDGQSHSPNAALWLRNDPLSSVFLEHPHFPESPRCVDNFPGHLREQGTLSFGISRSFDVFSLHLLYLIMFSIYVFSSLVKFLALINWPD